MENKISSVIENMKVEVEEIGDQSELPGLPESITGNTEVNTTTFFWSVSATKQLIDLYQKYRSKVGCTKMKNIKNMWDVIAKELTELLETEVSSKNCENRWKVLDRNYKKWVDNKKSIGRGRKQFEFAEEMQVIYGQKRSVDPEITLGSDSQHVPTGLIEENVSEVSETPITNEISRRETLRKRAVKERKTVLEQIREDKLRYQEERLDFLREAHRQTMALLQERNEIERERNKILLEKKCRCDNIYEI